MVYIYEMSFSNVKNWLPQTTEKMIKYLENLAKNNSKNKIEFDINKTQWKIYIKPKNDKAGLQLSKVIKKDNTVLDNLDKFKKVLELSHLVEICLKAFFEKMTFTSKQITYTSYKNQHEYLVHKEKIDALGERAKKFFAAPKIVKEKEHSEASLLEPIDVMLNQKEILNAISFEFVENENTFLLGFNNNEDKQENIYTLYQIDKHQKNVSLKYFFDKNLAKEIYNIKNFSEHPIAGKIVKRIVLEQNLKEFSFKK